MIDLSTETLITFAEAAQLFPRRRHGARPNLSTLYRWSGAGFRGVQLETVQAAGTRCTTREAVARFIQRLSSEGSPAPALPVRNAKAQAEASEYLDNEGVGAATATKSRATRKPRAK